MIVSMFVSYGVQKCKILISSCGREEIWFSRSIIYTFHTHTICPSVVFVVSVQ